MTHFMDRGLSVGESRQRWVHRLPGNGTRVNDDGIRPQPIRIQFSRQANGDTQNGILFQGFVDQVQGHLVAQSDLLQHGRGGLGEFFIADPSGLPGIVVDVAHTGHSESNAILVVRRVQHLDLLENVFLGRARGQGSVGFRTNDGDLGIHHQFHGLRCKAHRRQCKVLRLQWHRTLTVQPV